GVASGTRGASSTTDAVAAYVGLTAPYVSAAAPAVRSTQSATTIHWRRRTPRKVTKSMRGGIPIVRAPSPWDGPACFLRAGPAVMQFYPARSVKPRARAHLRETFIDTSEAPVKARTSFVLWAQRQRWPVPAGLRRRLAKR